MSAPNFPHFFGSMPGVENLSEPPPAGEMVLSLYEAARLLDIPPRALRGILADRCPLWEQSRMVPESVVRELYARIHDSFDPAAGTVLGGNGADRAEGDVRVDAGSRGTAIRTVGGACDGGVAAGAL